MPQYKRQHYLPSAYLKYFSVDQANCTRESFIWRFDGQNQRLVPVVSQCSEDYLYSRGKAAQTEKMFQRGENIYCQCVDKLRSRKPLSGKNYGDLVLMMFDFHLRNAVHKNLTGKEGIDAYNLRNRIFMGKILLGRDDGQITIADIKNHLERNWSIQIVSAMPSSMFITSDHPSVWTLVNTPAVEPRPDLHLVTLPLTPKYTAVAFDKRVLQVVSNQATSDDEGTLNVGRIENAEHCVYASNPLSDAQMNVVRIHFARKTNSHSEVRETAWKFSLQHLPAKYHFSFIRLNPPLM
jgi:hypothetical protein